jgi:hypothetical protein
MVVTDSAPFSNAPFAYINFVGNAGELHETAIMYTGAAPKATVVLGSNSVKQQTLDNVAIIIQYTTSSQTVVEVGTKILLYIMGKFLTAVAAVINAELTLDMIERSEAYQFWSLHLPGTGPYASFNTKDTVLIKGGYLIRSAQTSDGTLSLVGDLNATASFEVIAPAAATKRVTFNGDNLSLKKTGYGTLLATKRAQLPAVTVPDLQHITWVRVIVDCTCSF